MARSTFGGFGGDQVSLDPAGNAGYYKAATNYTTGTFWSASTGGTQYTDLIDPVTSVALTGVSTDTHGHVVPFKGPDGILEGWLDFGGGRFKVTAVDANALDSRYVKSSLAQTVEGTPRYVVSIAPVPTGREPFQVVENSFANSAGGAGTYNHGVWYGWNAARHADASGAVTAGMPAVYMGFEDNYFDSAGDLAYGVEWYVGYVTPDGTTIAAADLRPFYTRVTDSTTNTAAKNVITRLDIGSGTGGSLSVWGSVKSGAQLFTITPTQVLSSLPLNVTGQIAVSMNSGAGNMLIKSGDSTNVGSTASLTFQLGTLTKWQITSDKFNEIYLFDSTGNRVHTNWITGTSSDTALVQFNATLQLNNTAVTSASAGTATALPATPQGYFQIKDSAGVTRKVPYYA